MSKEPDPMESSAPTSDYQLCQRPDGSLGIRLRRSNEADASPPDLADRIADLACQFSCTRHVLATPTTTRDFIARTVREQLAASPELAQVREAVGSVVSGLADSDALPHEGGCRCIYCHLAPALATLNALTGKAP